MQVPTYGIFENISSMAELLAMPQWCAERPLRIVTGYTHVCFLFHTSYAYFCTLIWNSKKKRFLKGNILFGVYRLQHWMIGKLHPNISCKMVGIG